ncbi:uncharacterized protein EHS24_003168 [Apiotrichum porosum]|uniref:THUMP domain-containing protein n=1 Tax=Apiotrichum porosum TaxID=105984 RepID=A0A427XFI5_9TREE|nr:uncharacterized protein EHS24_003168 [Apiotrichum porosum]RSH77608.1 hypothetical protein EHS24_003168 [Apiotrichum porosum]
MPGAGPSKKGNNKSKYRAHAKRATGPPKGGDGQGAFAAGPFAKYRTQPLVTAGISVTAVQGKERIAEREILEALEEAADELYPETKMEDEAAAGGDDDEDIEDMLKKELATMSGEPGKKSPRFRLCKRETACVVYIIVLAPLDPVKLVTHIMEGCERARKCSLRFVQRLTPITRAGNGTLNSLAELARDVLPAGFHTEDGRGLKFGINTHTRNSAKMERLDMIKTVAEEVVKLNPEHKVDLTNSERTVMVELFKFNPSRVAKDAAIAAGDAVEEDEVAAPATNRSGEHAKSRGHAKNANRERRAEGIAQAEAAKTTAAAAVPAKRKAEESAESLEDGEVNKKEDVESGEIVEDEKAVLGEEFEEVIQDGRATKMRREE